MPVKDTATIDFKALTRTIRSGGAAACVESIRLLEGGETERAAKLSKAADDLAAQAAQLEAWRRVQAKTIRRAVLAITTQRAALADLEQHDEASLVPRQRALLQQATSLTEGVATQLEAIATQLDVTVHDEAIPRAEERFKQVAISAAAVFDTLQGLSLHHADLMRLAESLERHGLQAGDIGQVHGHASALEGIREDLALSVPENLEEPPC
jgi:hypothetical protein